MSEIAMVTKPACRQLAGEASAEAAVADLVEEAVPARLPHRRI